MKRIIAIVAITCMIASTPVCASMKTHRLKASGEYYIMQMSGKKELKYAEGWDNLSKKEKREVMRLYKNNPRKLYKKYK